MAEGKALQIVRFLVSLFFSGLSPYKIWIRPLSPKCVTTEIGHVITLFCNVPGSTLTVYEWTKEGQVLANDSRDSVLNVTISSLEDFGEYTCHAVSSDGVTSYNISVCQSTADVEEASEGIPVCKSIFKVTIRLRI